MGAMPPIVRLYRPEDRAAVLQIAADTGFFGAPVEAFMQDRRLMQDVFVYEQTGIQNGRVMGKLKSTGLRPLFAEKFAMNNIGASPATIFERGEAL